jgi:hypothetical protein
LLDDVAEAGMRFVDLDRRRLLLIRVDESTEPAVGDVHKR